MSRAAAAEKPKRRPPVAAFIVAALAVVALALAASIGNPSNVARFFALIYITAASLLALVLVFMFWGEGREGASYAAASLALLASVPVLVALGLA